jgi:ubiquinone/menaquinone biosynthesis C-methylase UbiE
MNVGPIGNVYDKYATRNPIARRLMQGFLDDVSDLYLRCPAREVLEVGAGEGHLASHLVALRPPEDRFIACDLSLEKVSSHVDPRVRFEQASIYGLPYGDKSFDLVVCCEVLEHLEEPERALAELLRVSKRHLIVSTPREPLWRVLNCMRGKYLGQWGNTPGHIQHFSATGLLSLLRRHVEVVEVRQPIPWTMALCRVRLSP